MPFTIEDTSRINMDIKNQQGGECDEYRIYITDKKEPDNIVRENEPLISNSF